MKNLFRTGPLCCGAIVAVAVVSLAQADPVVEKLHRVNAGEITITLERSVAPVLGLTAGIHHVIIGESSSLLAVSANDEFVRPLSGVIRLEPGDLDFVIAAADPFGEGAEFNLVSSDELLEQFNLYGVNYSFDPATEAVRIDAQLQLSPMLAKSIDSPELAGSFVGSIAIHADTKLHAYTIYEVDNVVSVLMPEGENNGGETRGGPNTGIVDVIVGELPATQQFGRVGTRVGVAVGTTSCNKGTIPLNWFALPNVDHPVIPQNMYRLKDDRFEQLGHSFLKHAFTALQQNACNFGCTGGCSGTTLCGGCSDPYSAGLNSGPNLGSRSWVQPFTGAYPNTANNHAGHSHDGISHRIIIEDADLVAAQNPGATYFVEGHYVTPHEYNHVASRNAGAMFNNVSHRRVTPTGAAGGTWTFPNAAATVRELPAVSAWTGSTQVNIEPDPGNDGRAILAYKVTGPVGGLYHYEYALYNMNLDRSISAFTIPVGAGAAISNVAFRAPPPHPAWANDGTAGSSGLSGAPWIATVSADRVEWRTQAFAENTNANAIRWGTLYNFRFDSDQPPQVINANVETFKIVGSVAVAAQAPQGVPCPGDLDGNRIVDLPDLAMLLSNFGMTGDATPDRGDMDGDLDIDLEDLGAMLALYGVGC